MQVRPSSAAPSRRLQCRSVRASQQRSGQPGVVSFEAELYVALGDVVDTRRAASVQMAAQKLTIADVAQAFERAQKLPARDRYVVVNAIATRWAELDPLGAAAVVMALADRAGRQSALVAVAQRWAVDLPEEAFHWLTANVPARQQQMISAVCSMPSRGAMRHGPSPCWRRFPRATASV